MKEAKSPSRPDKKVGPSLFALGCMVMAVIPLFRGSASLGQFTLLFFVSFVAGLAAGRLIRAVGVGGVFVLIVSGLLPASVLSGAASPSAAWVYAWSHLAALFVAALLFPQRREEEER